MNANALVPVPSQVGSHPRFSGIRRSLSTVALGLVCASLPIGCAAARQDYRVSRARPMAPPAESAQAPQFQPEVTADLGKNREGYNEVIDNAFRNVADHPLSTFSVDVDTASYANVRRMIQNGQKPIPSAVRNEEFINYFQYRYDEPGPTHPIGVHTEVANAPWAPNHRLIKIGLKARTMKADVRPVSNLVFLIDASGSMSSPNKLPLLKQGLKTMLQGLDERDRISIVAYAGAAGLVLPPTSASDKNRIFDALDRLNAGGSTNGGQGIELAYQVAQQNFVKGGTNRVMLATDGDFNVGTSSQGELISLIERKAKSGVFLTVLGFGMGNYQDGTLELISNKGDGNYAYIDSENEAKKVLLDELHQTTITLAKDVKLQVEFNPTQVSSYRLIGYSNRMLKDEDFNDDKKDAGDMGAGHTVTAFYEVEMRGDEDTAASGVDALRYQEDRTLADAASTNELLTLKIRYKDPESANSVPFAVTASDSGRTFDDASTDFRFAAAVASFGMVLRDSKYKGSATFESVQAIASDAVGSDSFGYRAEFLELVESAAKL